LTCRSLVVDVLEVRLVLAVKADLAVNQGQVLAARAVLVLLVPQVVPVRAQVLPRHPPPKPADLDEPAPSADPDDILDKAITEEQRLAAAAGKPINFSQAMERAAAKRPGAAAAAGWKGRR
jgi:hypothetical protein